MPALTAANVTVTVVKARRTARFRYNTVKVQFGDGALTYPAGGVPLPAFGAYGMRMEIEHLAEVDVNDASGIIWKYDKDNNKLRGYIMGLDISAAGSATLDDYPINTTNQPLATASLSVSFQQSLGAGVKYLGELQELTTTHAPAAQTLYFEAMGR